MKAVLMAVFSAGLVVILGSVATAEQVVPLLATTTQPPPADPAASIKIKAIHAKYDPRKKDVTVAVDLQVSGKANTTYYVQLAATDGKNTIEVAGDIAATTDAKGKTPDVHVRSNRNFFKPDAKVTFIAGLTAGPVATNPNQKALSTDSKSVTLPDGKKK